MFLNILMNIVSILKSKEGATKEFQCNRKDVLVPFRSRYLFVMKWGD